MQCKLSVGVSHSAASVSLGGGSSGWPSCGATMKLDGFVINIHTSPAAYRHLSSQRKHPKESLAWLILQQGQHVLLHHCLQSVTWVQAEHSSHIHRRKPAPLIIWTAAHCFLAGSADRVQDWHICLVGFIVPILAGPALHSVAQVDQGLWGDVVSVAAAAADTERRLAINEVEATCRNHNFIVVKS